MSVFYKVQDRETETLIDVFKTRTYAEECMKKLEDQDKEDGIYEPDFYEIERVVLFEDERGNTL